MHWCCCFRLCSAAVTAALASCDSADALSFGLRGFGAHSNDDEYIFIDSIAPRLYLSTRMVMDVGSGKVKW